MSAPNICITEVVSQKLWLKNSKIILISQDMIMRWAASTVYTRMDTEIEIKLCTVAYLWIFNGTWIYMVPIFIYDISFTVVVAEQPCVMMFFDQNKFDLGLIFYIKWLCLKKIGHGTYLYSTHLFRCNFNNHIQVKDILIISIYHSCIIESNNH